MRKEFLLVPILVLAVSVISCAKPAPPPPQPPQPPQPPIVMEPKWTYGKEAIHLNVKSDSQLNLYQGTAHTTVLCIYHLRDPNAYNQLLEEKDGLYKLLECSHFDPSVTFVKKVSVQPGQERSEKLDRAEGAKYVGVVAGYYMLSREGSARLYEIPIVEEKKGNTIYQMPGVLKIDLFLGTQGIQGPQVK